MENTFTLFIEKNPRINGLAQFKPIVQGQLCNVTRQCRWLSQTECWVTEARQEYMLHDSIGKKLINKQNYAVQSQHSVGPWVFLWKGFWDVGNRLFLDLFVGYVSVFSLWKFWGLYIYDLCIFCMYVILGLRISLKFLGETKLTTPKLQNSQLLTRKISI